MPLLSRRNFLGAAAAALPLHYLRGEETPLFALREMDMHLHAGLERDVADLNEWIDLSVADGRRVMVLLDHMELFRGKTDGRYPMGAAGHKAFMADIEAQQARLKDLLIFKGWEINQIELDKSLDDMETAPMHMVDVIGWHIDRSLSGEPPDGQLLLKRVRQLKELRRQFPVPMMLFHPFARHISNLQQTARGEGRNPDSIPPAQYRFFQPGEQQELIALLKSSSIYLEISRAQTYMMKNPITREALIADIAPLAKAGVQFTVSTDAHYRKDVQGRFEPAAYCEPLGVTPENTNGIVRELIANRKAKAGRHSG